MLFLLSITPKTPAMTFSPSPRFLSGILTMLFALVFSPYAAAEAGAASEPFTEARFQTLQAENKLVMVDIAADWCPTCRRQHAAISKLQAQHPDLNLHVLTVDFDKQKEWVRHFKAPRQSTLILFKGTQQRWFAVAEVREEVILAELQKAAGATVAPAQTPSGAAPQQGG